MDNKKAKASPPIVRIGTPRSIVIIARSPGALEEEALPLALEPGRKRHSLNQA
jgi:hypothetical protein